MVGTNNKKLHQNLWTWCHFLGSALIFILVMASSFYFSWKVGIYSGNASDLANNTTLLNWNQSFIQTFVNEENTALFPVYSLMTVAFGGSFDGSTVSYMIYTFAIGLDCVLWFNLAVWTLQLMLFVPDWCFHMLERWKDK